MRSRMLAGAASALANGQRESVGSHTERFGFRSRMVSRVHARGRPLPRL